jgi:hypothetical protein
MSSDNRWYEGLRDRNPWLPPGDKVLEAEATWPQPSKGPATMDLRVIVDLTEAVDWEIREVDQALKEIRRHLKRIERQLEGEQ